MVIGFVSIQMSALHFLRAWTIEFCQNQIVNRAMFPFAFLVQVHKWVAISEIASENSFAILDYSSVGDLVLSEDCSPVFYSRIVNGPRSFSKILDGIGNLFGCGVILEKIANSTLKSSR